MTSVLRITGAVLRFGVLNLNAKDVDFTLSWSFSFL
jgi:hypothetical protein